VLFTSLLAVLGLSGCDGDKAYYAYHVQANEDQIEINAGESVEIDVLANDTATSDEGSDEKSNLVLGGTIGQPLHGSATKDGNKIVYVHNASDDATTDSFQYEAVLFSESSIGSVSVTIVQPEDAVGNQAPEANAGENKRVQSGESITITGSGTDSDGEIVSYKWKKGTSELATTAEFVYSPTAVGTDTLKLIVTDNDGATASDEMNVTVTEAPASNAKPVANASIIYMDPECNIGTVVPFETNLSGTDADDDSLTFEGVAGATYGTVVVESDGSGTFTLDDSEDQSKCFDGIPNSFTFKVNDGTVDSDAATVTISSPTSEE
jgi:VCBS repeat-containing protein